MCNVIIIIILLWLIYYLKYLFYNIIFQNIIRIVCLRIVYSLSFDLRKFDLEYFHFFPFEFFHKEEGGYSCVLKSILWDTNNQSAVSSSLKSPLDWLWRMNTCFYYILLSILPERHVFPRASDMRFIIVIPLAASQQILNTKIHFHRKASLMHSRKF